MIVGAGAGGGVVAKELSSAGLRVVVLERGKWYSAADCRKDDLHNQRTAVLGNAFGPEEEGNPRVLVVGGGIAGLAAARALLRRGVGPDVVERAAAWSQPGAGMYLPANSVRALGALGLQAALFGRAWL